MTETFKYDVAISFLQEDETIAKQLSDILSERLDVFVYFNRQQDIAGTDGEQTFNRVFGSEARIVIVLYREIWGDTPWTRIEATAIRNRAFEEGYDFLTVIAMDSPVKVPKWLPKNRLLIGLDRWGVEGAAAAIESRVQESGGQPKARSATEQAALLAQQKKNDGLRAEKLNSELGVKRVHKEVSTLFALIQKKAEAISASNTEIKMSATTIESRRLNLHSWGYHVYISWLYVYSNSLQEAQLTVELIKFDRFAQLRGEAPSEPLAQETFLADLRLPDTYGWAAQEKKGRFFSSEELAEHCVTLLLDLLRKYHPWNPDEE